MKKRRTNSSDPAKETIANRCLVGGFVPQLLSEQFAIFCLWSGATKSDMVKRMIQEKLDVQSLSTLEMIDQVVDNYYNSYNGVQSFSAFLKIVHKELKARKITPQIASLIESKLIRMQQDKLKERGIITNEADSTSSRTDQITQAHL